MLKALGFTTIVALAAPAFGAPQVGQPAPAFRAVDSNGKTRSLAEFKGKPVVLEWTNAECPFVRKHYSGNMQALQKAATTDGVVWLTVNSGAPGKQGHVDGDGAKAIVAAKGAAPTAYLLDPQGTIGRAYAAKTTPHMYVIDPAGKLVYMGGIDDTPTANPADIKTAKNYVTAALADLKAKRPVAVATSKPYGCSVKYAG
jgi:AhpC/TSA family